MGFGFCGDGDGGCERGGNPGLSEEEEEGEAPVIAPPAMEGQGNTRPHARERKWDDEIM